VEWRMCENMEHAWIVDVRMPSSVRRMRPSRGVEEEKREVWTVQARTDLMPCRRWRMG